MESLEDLFNDDSFLSNFLEPPQSDISSSVDFVASSGDGDYTADIEPAANLGDEQDFPVQPDGDYAYQQIVLPEPLPIVSPSILKRCRQYEIEDAAVQPRQSKRNSTAPYAHLEDQFGETTLPENTVKSLSVGFVPKNTTANTMWAVRNFQDWVSWRNELEPDNGPVPSDLLFTSSATELNKWLSYFIAETRKKDGKEFPSSSITLLLQGIRRFMKSYNPEAPNFLDERNPDFEGLRAVRDNVSRHLRSSGIGAQIKHTEIISVSEECSLWSQGVLSTSTPKSLLNAVFFCTGKTFCLRGGREHYALKISQFSFSTEVHNGVQREMVEYVENGSKNRSGSYKDKAKNKVVKQYADPSLGEQCCAYLLKTYLSKLPQSAFEKDVFYLRPKEQKPLSNDEAWFIQVPVGRNTLQLMVMNICLSAGIEGKANHSLRATSASRMFDANIPEKLIQERTGHRSLTALRLYERTSTQQNIAVSRILSSSSAEASYDEMVKKDCNKENRCPITSKKDDTPSMITPYSSLNDCHDDGKKPALASILGNVQNCTININIQQ